MRTFEKLTEANVLAAQSELRAAREVLGLTQQQVAEASGLPATLVCSVERGAAERMAAVLREALRERVAASLDTDDPDAAALAALRGLGRVTT